MGHFNAAFDSEEKAREPYNKNNEKKRVEYRTGGKSNVKVVKPNNMES
jgi:hypothetical protein